MAQLFVDGFDNYTTTFWEAFSGSITFGNTSPSTRFANPTGCVSQWMQVSSGSFCQKNLISTPTTVIAGVAFRLTSLPAIGTRSICGFVDTGVNQVSLQVSSAGALQFARGATPVTLIGSATGTGTIVANVWYEIAIVITISTTVGQVTAYLNGNSTPIISSSANLNTQASGNATVNQFFVANGTGSGSNSTYGISQWDDVYVWDTTGGTQNSWPGNDARILTKLPTGAGNYTNWTPNGLGTNWSCNAQLPPNTSDYVSNNTPGTKDSYVTTAAGLVATPFSVAVRQSIYKDDGNTHTAQALVRSAGTDGTGTAFNVNSSPTFVDTVFPNDPATSSPWTGAAADATQIGVVETS